MRYDENPQQILFDNRTRIPTLDQLVAQVLSLARLAVNAAEDAKRITALEAVIAGLKVKKQVTNPVRSLDVDFVVSPDSDADVVYSVDLSLVANIVGIATNEAKVSLMVNGVEMDSVRHNLQATIILGLSLQHTHRYILQSFVPTGATVKLTSTLTGTGTAAFAVAQESIYGQ